MVCNRTILVLAGALIGGCAEGRSLDRGGEPGGDASGAGMSADAGGVADGGGADGSSPDAAPPPGCEWRELLADGDFDDSNSRWMSSGDAQPIIASASSVTGIEPPSNPRFAWFLGKNSVSGHQLVQRVVIPANSTELRFHALKCFATEEPVSQQTAVDHLRVEFRSTSGSTLEVVTEKSNLQASLNTCSWLPLNFAPTKLSPGQTADLHLSARSNGSNTTHFLFDDLSLQALICP